jgi:hypothetical protein
LPRKFGIDKRYGHLSDLINAGHITRGEAMEEVKKPPYPETEQIADLEYVSKKLGLRNGAFDDIMNLPRKTFRDYRNSFDMVFRLKKIVNALRGRGWYPR